MILDSGLDLVLSNACKHIDIFSKMKLYRRFSSSSVGWDEESRNPGVYSNVWSASCRDVTLQDLCLIHTWWMTTENHEVYCFLGKPFFFIHRASVKCVSPVSRLETSPTSVCLSVCVSIRLSCLFAGLSFCLFSFIRETVDSAKVGAHAMKIQCYLLRLLYHRWPTYLFYAVASNSLDDVFKPVFWWLIRCFMHIARVQQKPLYQLVFFVPLNECHRNCTLDNSVWRWTMRPN